MPQVTTLHDDLAHAGAEPDYQRAWLKPRGTILLIEDWDDVRGGLAQLLELHGFHVIEAKDGDEALIRLHDHSDELCLVLLDLRLPGSCDGHELRALQLLNPRTAHIPTIIVSAIGPDAIGLATLRPDAWLEKPFRWDQLFPLVQRYAA